MRLIKILVIVLAVVAAGAAAVHFLKPHPQREYHTDTSRLQQIREMVDLTTLEFHEEIPVKDQIDGKWLVARMSVDGSVKFDLDSVRFEERGDTTFVFLPKERIDIYESTEPNSYVVIDSWDANRPVFGRKLSATEENTIKTRARDRIEAHIRGRGYIERARRNAVETLTPLFNRMTGPYDRQGPVVVAIR